MTLLKIDINHPDLDTNPNIAAIESPLAIQQRRPDHLAAAAGRWQNADSALTLQILQPHQRPSSTIGTMTGRTAHPVIYAEHLRSSEIRRYRQSRGRIRRSPARQHRPDDLKRPATRRLTPQRPPSTATANRRRPTLRIRKCQKTICRATKSPCIITATFRSRTTAGQVHYAYEEIDGDFWVIEAYENYGADGFTVGRCKSAISTATSMSRRSSLRRAGADLHSGDCGAAPASTRRDRGSLRQSITDATHSRSPCPSAASDPEPEPLSAPISPALPLQR